MGYKRGPVFAAGRFCDFSARKSCLFSPFTPVSTTVLRATAAPDRPLLFMNLFCPRQVPPVSLPFGVLTAKALCFQDIQHERILITTLAKGRPNCTVRSLWPARSDCAFPPCRKTSRLRRQSPAARHRNTDSYSTCSLNPPQPPAVAEGRPVVCFLLSPLRIYVENHTRERKSVCRKKL